jgi:hypothetical protein
MNQEKMISVDNKKVGVTVKYANLFDSASRSVSVTVSFVNRDSTAVTLPKYGFELHAGDGYSFPLTFKSADNVTLNPLQETTVNLKTVLPSSVSSDDVQLLMLQQVSGSSGTDNGTGTTPSVNVPVAVFNLNDLTTGSTNSGMYISTQTGSYYVTLADVQRLPWDDTDIVAAHFTIKNTSFTQSVPVPNLSGYVTIDGIETSAADTKYIQPDNVLSIAPNSQIDGYVITKVPFATDFNSVQIGLQENLGDNNTREVAQFVQSSSSSSFTEVAEGSTYEIPTQGKAASVKVRKTSFYTGTDSNLLYTEVELGNEENRLANLPQLVGYYTDGEGGYYKATVTQSKTATQAHGKTVVTAWANIPRTVNSSSLKLLLGEGVTDNKLAVPNGEISSYINGAIYNLPADQTAVSNTLLGLDFFPYQLSLTNVAATLSKSSALNVSVDYHLSRNMDYETGDYEHKVLLEITDVQYGKVFDKEIAIGTDLTEGDHTYSYTINDSFFEDRSAGTYQLDVYDVFQGKKKKIGSQALYYLF